ncbi:hypothetical protein BZG36_01365 [Bifiguratus adelaidae]|uniref:Uncharacterized protein n=1 Tax=Bifiguratus adelaidae TaxID=1938954 RepID=A0A261Y3G5_9FUNG|nr:hypothetical protein BZG36_01365 [Bifiguratus adelaidae]
MATGSRRVAMEELQSRLEGLRSRKPKVNPEEEAEFLDEEEQERVIEEMRRSNEESNRSIRKGLAGLPVLLLVLFVLYMSEYKPAAPIEQRPIIPIPTSTPVHSVAYFPILSGTLSITSLIFSALFIITLPVALFPQYTDRIPIPKQYILSIALGLGIVPLLLAIGTSWVEALFWALPLGVCVLNIIATRMMESVTAGLDGLEAMKYNYKGA